MHWIDLLIVATIAWFTFRAFTTGLIREVVTLVALVAGAVLAGHYYGELAADIEFVTDDLATRELIAFASIFGGIVVLGQLAGHVLRQTAALLLLGPVDRVGGAAFGFAKGVLLVEVLLLAAVAFPVASSIDEAVDESALAPIFLEDVPVMLRLMPGEFESAVEGFDPAAAGLQGVEASR